MIHHVTRGLRDVPDVVMPSSGRLRQRLSSSQNVLPSRNRRSNTPPPSTRLDRLIYILILLTTLLAAFYAYRVGQDKTDAGGWWSRAIIRPSRQKCDVENTICQKADCIEESISALARALEIPSNRLAEAIAIAVRENMPSRSSSSAPA